MSCQYLSFSRSRCSGCESSKFSQFARTVAIEEVVPEDAEAGPEDFAAGWADEAPGFPAVTEEGDEVVKVALGIGLLVAVRPALAK